MVKKVYNIMLNSANTASYTVDDPASLLGSLTYKCDFSSLMGKYPEAYRKSYVMTLKLRSVQVDLAQFNPATDNIGLYIRFDGIQPQYNISSDNYGNITTNYFCASLNAVWNGAGETGSASHKHIFQNDAISQAPIFFDSLNNNCYSISVQFKNIAIAGFPIFSNMVNYNLQLSFEEQ